MREAVELDGGRSTVTRARVGGLVLKKVAYMSFGREQVH